MPKQYSVGSHQIILPDDHPLPNYQKIWRRYDLALGYVAKITFQKYPTATAIDIGANVGDTAALIQKHQSVEILCIEGVPDFLKYLKHNAAIIKNVCIEEAFIGNPQYFTDLGSIKKRGGTASIVASTSSQDRAVKVSSLESVLNHHPQFWKSKLLKIDTDGFDFTIILNSLNTISKLRPVLYFEYDVLFTEDALAASLEAIQKLSEVGYMKFIVYDNYGNYMLSLTSEYTTKFIDLNAYLISNRKQSGRTAVYYFDICAFHEEDIDLFEKVKSFELQTLLGKYSDFQWDSQKSINLNHTTIF